MTQYYVRTDGNNANTGLTNTAGGAWATPAGSNGKVSAGDFIDVADGTYTGGFTITSSGSAGNQITFRSTNKWGAKIVGGSPIWSNTGNYITVDGFDISGSSSTHGLLFGPWSGGDVGHHGIAQNNYIHDTSLSACGQGGALTFYSITGGGKADRNVIKNVFPSGIGSCSTMQGIYISEPNMYVTNNIVSNVAAIGITQWHQADKSVIIGNTVFNCLWGIQTGTGDSGSPVGGSSNNYVANNICVGCSIGIKEFGAIAPFGNQYRNNCNYNNTTAIDVGAGATVSGNITTNPLFVNYQANGSGDYHLTASSPCINTGLSSGTQQPSGTTVVFPTIDYDGITRPQAATYDMGAYEYVSAGISPALTGGSMTATTGSGVANRSIGL